MSEIAIVAYDPKGTQLDDVVFRPNGKSFVLGVPDAVLQDCERLGVDKTFFTTNAVPSYYGSENLEELESRVGIQGFAEMVKTSTLVVAAKFMDTIRKVTEQGGSMPHNGPKYGISKISRGASSDGRERMTLDIGLHDTSYFTFSVMNYVYKTLRDINHSAVADNALRFMPRPAEKQDQAVFFNSLGVNAGVLVKSEDDTRFNSYLFGTRRSGELHVAMNEAVHPSEDVAGLESFTLDDLYRRGMEEELGLVNVEQHEAVPPVMRELFIVKSVGQFGIHLLTELDMTADELREHHARARDHDENTQFVTVPFNQAGLYFVNDPATKIVPYTRDLIRGLTREMT